MGGLEACNAEFFGNPDEVVSMLGAGNYGIAFKVKKDKTEFVVKVSSIDIDPYIKNEEILYKIVKEGLVKQQTPHFVYTWDAKDCNGPCHYLSAEKIVESDPEKKKRINQILDAASKKCYLFFAERFDGDMEDFFKNEMSEIPDQHKCEVILSIMFQVSMAQSYFLKKGWNHNDLNVGNVLYLKLEKDGYFQYIDSNGKPLWIRHYGYLFAIWDFGFATRDRSPIPDAFDVPYVSYYIKDIPDQFKAGNRLKIRSCFLFEMIMHLEGLHCISEDARCRALILYLKNLLTYILFSFPPYAPINELNKEHTFMFSKKFLVENLIRGTDIERHVTAVLPREPPAEITASYDAKEYLTLE